MPHREQLNFVGFDSAMTRASHALSARLKKLLGLPEKEAPSERQRAQDLIAAVDAGGLPLNPARVNDIARQLGLEVSSKAPVQETIERIRIALTYKSP
jgi:hypothetical protein